MKKGFLTVLLSVLAGGLTAFAVVKAAEPQTNPDTVVTDASGQAVEYRTVNLAETDYPDFTYAAESAVEAVVYVEVTVQRQSRSIDPFEFFFGFGDGYGFGQPRSQEQRGSGSGVIIRPDGYIVTNNHVVAGATKVSVTLNDNREFEATVVGTDPATDVAIIKVDAQNLPALPMGDSDQLRLGEWVLAIGSPLGAQLRSTITAGIVSAKGRSMPDNSGEFKIESFIQTDAAVNPGNSGGALVNKKGELVGINTAIVSQTGSYTGYSFAVPVNIVKRVAQDLMDFGSVKRAVLGIRMINVDKKFADEMKLSSVTGVYINEVLKGSAAEKAGLKENDVIVAIDGQKVTDGSSVQAKVSGYHPGDKATITYIRDGKTQEAQVVFQAASDESNGEATADGSMVFYGATLKAASPEALKALGLKSGVEIVSLGSGKMAEAGAKAGSVITYVNDEAVSKPEEVVAKAKKASRAIYIEGVDKNRRSFYFGFGK
ncbi:MAG: Do family serine endopeptidase [Bacteroidales bacterium]|nr:Do family serine endopeptidase [Bacteroidales bacterium]